MLFQHWIEPTHLYLRGYRDHLSLGDCFYNGTHVQKNLETAKTYYQQAADEGNPAAFNKLSQVSQSLGQLGEGQYYLGQYYERTEQWPAAVEAYKIAAAKGYTQAFYQLGKLYQADQGSTQSQSHLSQDLPKAVMYYRKAVAAGHSPALDALLSLNQQGIPQATLCLAQMYQSGEIEGQQDPTQALEYYHRAADALQDPEAAYQLGQCYRHGKSPVQQDLPKAWHYYGVAAQVKHSQAFEALKRLANRLNDLTCHFQLATLYEMPFQDKLSALHYFQWLADQGHEAATHRVWQLIHQDRLCAQRLAQLYQAIHQQQGALSPWQQQDYIIALTNPAQAEPLLQPRAASGDAEAQYLLGFGVYHQQGQCNQAIAWCLKAAEQQHPKAMAYFQQVTFTAEQLVLIAQHYETGDSVQQDLPKARDCYQKACDLQHPEAAYRLGQLYQLAVEHGGLGCDHEQAAEYFRQAVLWGHPDALIPLKRLRDEVSIPLLVKLGTMYLQLPPERQDPVSATDCYERTVEIGSTEAQTLLAQLYTSPLNQGSAI